MFSFEISTKSIFIFVNKYFIPYYIIILFLYIIIPVTTAWPPPTGQPVAVVKAGERRWVAGRIAATAGAGNRPSVSSRRAVATAASIWFPVD